jgi:UDP-N-acetyl-D-glucosamine dehydrogenase
MTRLGEADVVHVAVPTPIGGHREPDLSYVVESGRHIGRALRAGQLIVLESTTYPGTTREEFLGAIQAEADPSLTLGQDYFVAYSPEREDPGRKDTSSQAIPKLVGGLDQRSGDLAEAVYNKGFAEVVRVSAAEVAEASKLLENIFRSVNIALVNEMKVVLTELGVDVWEVIEAASTKPFGFMPFYPGPGLGGHCIPIDPFYLSWKAREVGKQVEFIELAGVVNTEMPRYVIQRLADAMNDRGKAMSRSRVLVLGLAYKPNVSDQRESPSFELIERLQKLGAQVEYHDPYVPVAATTRKYDLGLKSIELTADAIASYDAVLIATDHSNVDYELVAFNAPLIIDTRNAMRPWADRLGSRLVFA